MLGELVQAGGVGVQQRGHLVDERAGAAGARAVHALLDAGVEVDDLGVLAAQLDGHIRLRDERFHCTLARDDLLHELQAEPLREQKPARTGDGAGHLRLGQQRRRALEQIASAGAHIGVVALILCVDDLVGVIQNGELDRGGPHVDTQVQIARRVLGVPDGTLGDLGNLGPSLSRRTPHARRAPSSFSRTWSTTGPRTAYGRVQYILSHS